MPVSKLKQRRVGTGDAAHGAQCRVHLLRLHQKGVDAGEPHGRRARAIQAGHQFVIHGAGENFEHGVHSLGRGHAQAIHEAALDAALREVARHLLAAAVNHHDLDARRRAPRDLRRQRVARIGGIEQRAAQLDQKLSQQTLRFGIPSIRFMFCTAWPAAPFTRLSMALTTTARPVCGVERHADIAEVGARHGVQIGHVPGL